MASPPNYPSIAITESLYEIRISLIYKTLARKAGVEEKIQRISCYSMRDGGAHDLLKVGAILSQIMVKGGWAKTDTVMRYVEQIQQPISCECTFLR